MSLGWIFYIVLHTTNISLPYPIIPGETNALYYVPTGMEGTYYFYCTITNTITQNGDGGIKTATVNINVAKVSVISATADTQYTGKSLASVVYGDSVTGLTVGTVKLDGSSDNITYGVISGNLPLGVFVESGGNLAGNAWCEVGSYDFTVLAARPTTIEMMTATFTLVVKEAELTITANDKSRTYGDENPLFNGVVTGYKTFDGIVMNAVTGSFAYSCNATQTTNAGRADIVPSSGTATSKYYDFKFIKGTLTINKAQLSIKADNKSKLRGLTDPVYTATATGFKNGQTKDDLGELIYTAEGTSGTGRKVGSYTINVAIPSSSVSANYSITIEKGTLLVTVELVQIVVGNSHNLALDKDGYLYVCGDSYYGQLGLGDESYRSFPTQLARVNIRRLRRGIIITWRLMKRGIYGHGDIIMKGY